MAAKKKAAKKAPVKKAAKKAPAKKAPAKKIAPRKPVKLTNFVKKQRQRLLTMQDELMDAMYGVQQETLRNGPSSGEASVSGTHPVSYKHLLAQETPEPVGLPRGVV